MVDNTAQKALNEEGYSNYEYSRNKAQVNAIHFRSNVTCIYFEDGSHIVVSASHTETGKLAYREGPS
jgi:hypothetical protein